MDVQFGGRVLFLVFGFFALIVLSFGGGMKKSDCSWYDYFVLVTDSPSASASGSILWPTN
jgi:hypothetical protein